MKPEITVFNHPRFGKIRTAFVGGETLFIATDIARALGYEDRKQAVAKHCKSGKASKILLAYIPHSNGIGGVKMKLVNEPNVNRLIMQSKLPSAVEFQDWVCEEVLPSIRKTGGYLAAKPGDTPETVLERTKAVYEDTIHRMKKELEKAKNESMQKDRMLAGWEPKIEYFEEALATDTLYSATQVAKSLNMECAKMNKKLHNLGIQYKRSGTWLLYARYMNCGLAEVRPYRYGKANGKCSSRPMLMWTEAGRMFIFNLAKSGKL